MESTYGESQPGEVVAEQPTVALLPSSGEATRSSFAFEDVVLGESVCDVNGYCH
ncbi:hypothetical protein G3T36_05440 [Diaminobutyricibacter tongyongensis]|uniref:Uncharacterized protein n=1 Tax=Leifsonia tongyongensis TaxID=1268043 RepID=A0A6L9XV69_9MICO|nr:hypothetical protein [Diaminobutyricibacter tongyongensis]NEN05309.1 hypothetical protein [Diaminobutyricibacter tongyongensis]